MILFSETTDAIELTNYICSLKQIEYKQLANETVGKWWVIEETEIKFCNFVINMYLFPKYIYYSIFSKTVTWFSNTYVPNGMCYKCHANRKLNGK